MITENKILIKNARELLSNRWGIAIATFLIYAVISSASGAIPVIGAIISLLISGPLMLGWAKFSLTISKNEEPNINQLFEGFTEFMKPFVTYLIMLVFIILWMLLLIIPGIIAAISYSMTFYIMAEDPSMEGMNAINKSKEMMNGYKWKFFLMGLRFLGWIILSILTFGIGFLWVAPWMQVSVANFYQDLKANNQISNVTV